MKFIFRILFLFYLSIIVIISISKIDNIELSHNFFNVNIYTFLFIISIVLIVFAVGLNALKKVNADKSILLRFTPIFVIIATLCIFFFTKFSQKFGGWVHQKVEYVHIQNSKKTINRQLFDKGALGFGGERIIEVTPFLILFTTIKEVDTLKIDFNKWRKATEVLE